MLLASWMCERTQVKLRYKNIQWGNYYEKDESNNFSIIGACDIVCKNFPDRLTQIKTYWLENSEMLEEKIKTTEDENTAASENNPIEEKRTGVRIIVAIICTMAMFAFVLMKIIQKKRPN